jgi:hypothetical protein
MLTPQQWFDQGCRSEEQMELLTLIGEGVQIGDIGADELSQMAGKPALSVSLADGRVVVLVGMTRDECRQCLPAFMAPARLTVSAA